MLEIVNCATTRIFLNDAFLPVPDTVPFNIFAGLKDEKKKEGKIPANIPMNIARIVRMK